MQKPSELFQSVTVKRYAVGSWSNGRYTDGAESTVTITASVYPVGARERIVADEGDRTKSQIAIITQDPIYTLDESTGREADRVLWDGAYWKVRSVTHYPNTPELTLYEAVAVREQAA